MKHIFHSQKLHDLLTATFLLFLTTILCFLLFFCISENPVNIALLYVLGTIAIAYYTNGYFYGILASFVGVIFINHFFTYPYFHLNFILPDYPFTFLFILCASLITSTLTSHLTKQAKTLALHEKQLAEANKEKMRANFLRAISHDLRTPVTSIINLLSDLEENEDYSPEERKKIIHNIYDDADWLLNMGDNLLSITRMQGTDSKLKTSPELVEEVISESVIRFKKRFPAAQVETSIPDEILLIPMDATLIEQVLMNLLENALVHSQSQKPIKLFVENQPHTVCFHVIDYGIGINPEYLDTIFDGICGSTPSDVRNRMGVGLSICKTIITAHNGTIIARNHEHGAEFVFTLPKEEPNDKI